MNTIKQGFVYVAEQVPASLFFMVMLLSGLVIVGFATPIFAYDFDGDGKDDILWQHTDSAVAVWLMNGGRIQRSAFLGGVPAAWTLSRIADVNGDGKSDVIWQHSTGVVAIWLMDGVTITAVVFPGSASSEWKMQK